MFLVNRVFNRPSTDVAFYTADTEFGTYYETTYMNTNKAVNVTVMISEDGLQKTVSTTWADEATWNAYKQDPVCIAHFSARNAYNAANGITTSRETDAV